jgi:hypothetical protein
MITEKDLDDLMRNPTIQHVAAQAHPFAGHETRLQPVASSAPANRSERALLFWIAVQTKVFLKHRGAVPNPMIEKVWKFADGDADVDIRAGIQGSYKKFKIKTSRTGPTSFQLRIVTWNGQGKEECEWERYGIYRGNNARAAIETVPTR